MPPDTEGLLGHNPGRLRHGAGLGHSRGCEPPKRCQNQQGCQNNFHQGQFVELEGAGLEGTP